ncbi:hypothetical protein SAMN05518854_1307 [Variovorax sp. YR266]|uniref:hypothetical protein n=1 Tax=Variovorax sp. YR266 TaxID=1884386 RepID=UPI0008974C9A|nr:hypothetical protein [Variovorax sp. YR266]SDZ72376.1 hypothetical protein SAMN05518854_1307 [Variovorax sp. YR266]
MSFVAPASEPSAMSPEDIAARNFFERHIFRLAELVYGEYFSNREYPFHLLLSEVRTLVKACEEFGLDDIDWLEKVVQALYSPHPSRFAPEDMSYLMSIIASNSSPEGKSTAILSFIQSLK